MRRLPSVYCDPVLLLAARQGRLGDEVLAVRRRAGGKRVPCSVTPPCEKSPLTLAARGRLQHLAVAPALPGVVDLLVARAQASAPT